MLNQALIEKIISDGYAVVPEVLNRIQCSALRDAGTGIAFLSDGIGINIIDALGISGIEDVVFSPRLLTLCTLALGHPIVLFPNITLRRNSAVPWHVDDAFRKAEGEWDSKVPRYLQCAVYLQGNTMSGGGLDVIPASHQLDLKGHDTSPFAHAKKLVMQGVSIKSNQGDAVVWDGRLLHRSTAPANGYVKTTDHFAFHWTFGARNGDNKRVMNHLVERGTDRGDIGNVDRRYSILKTFKFFNSASETFISKSLAANVILLDTSTVPP